MYAIFPGVFRVFLRNKTAPEWESGDSGKTYAIHTKRRQQIVSMQKDNFINETKPMFWSFY